MDDVKKNKDKLDLAYSKLKSLKIRLFAIAIIIILLIIVVFVISFLLCKN